jgi:hypothetical protein
MVKSKYLLLIFNRRIQRIHLIRNISIRLVKNYFPSFSRQLEYIGHASIMLLHVHGAAADDDFDGLLMFKGARSVDGLRFENRVYTGGTRVELLGAHAEFGGGLLKALANAGLLFDDFKICNAFFIPITKECLTFSDSGN